MRHENMSRRHLGREVKVSQSCLTFCDPHGLYSPWDSPGQHTGVGSLSLLQGVSPIQRSNPHCEWILYRLSHKGSPRILEWVVYPFSVDLPNPGIEPGSPALQTVSLQTELSGKAGKGICQICIVWLSLPYNSLPQHLVFIAVHGPCPVAKRKCYSLDALCGLPGL